MRFLNFYKILTFFAEFVERNDFTNFAADDKVGLTQKNFGPSIFGGKSMKREKTLLRQYAARAKSRLATGFWCEGRVKGELENLNNPNSDDEKLYRRVAEALANGEANPLAVVLDAGVMANLDDAARQRYVLGMAQRVNRGVERYNQAKVC